MEQEVLSEEDAEMLVAFADEWNNPVMPIVWASYDGSRFANGDPEEGPCLALLTNRSGERAALLMLGAWVGIANEWLLGLLSNAQVRIPDPAEDTVCLVWPGVEPML